MFHPALRLAQLLPSPLLYSSYACTMHGSLIGQQRTRNTAKVPEFTQGADSRGGAEGCQIVGPRPDDPA